MRIFSVTTSGATEVVIRDMELWRVDDLGVSTRLCIFNGELVLQGDPDGMVIDFWEAARLAETLSAFVLANSF